MKIYELFMDNGLTYEDHDHSSIWIVAEDETEANIRAKKELEDFLKTSLFNEFGSYELYEVIEVDGYKINVIVEEEKEK